MDGARSIFSGQANDGRNLVMICYSAASMRAQRSFIP
jgi:hypothetical protein